MTKHVAIYAILAIGMTFVILTGGIDLSVGSIAGLCAMMAGGFINEGITIGSSTYYPSIPMVMILTMAIGTFCGMINGLIIAKFNVAAFIATLGMWYVARGFAQIRSNGLTSRTWSGARIGEYRFPAFRSRIFPWDQLQYMDHAGSHAGCDVHYPEIAVRTTCIRLCGNEKAPGCPVWRLTNENRRLRHLRILRFRVG